MPNGEDLKVWVLTTKVTAVKVSLEIFAVRGKESHPASSEGAMVKGNPVQSRRHSKNGSPTAIVTIPQAVGVEGG